MLLCVCALKHRQHTHKGQKLYFTGGSHLKMKRLFKSSVEKTDTLQQTGFCSFIVCVPLNFFIFDYMIALFGLWLFQWIKWQLGKRVKYHRSHSSSCMLEIKEDLISLWVHILVYLYLQTLYLMYCGEFDLFILSSWNFVVLLDIYLAEQNQLWHLKHSPALKGVQNDKDPFTNLTYIISEILKYWGKLFLLA